MNLLRTIYSLMSIHIDKFYKGYRGRGICIMKQSATVNWIIKIVYIIIAVTLLAVSVNLFLGPHHIAAGGVTGLAIILEDVLNLDRSLVVLLFNIVILVLTIIFLGKKIFLNTVIGGTLLPIMLGVIPHAMIIEDIMLSVIFGSFIFGMGVAILFRNDASSGGTSIPPLIFKKYFKLNTSIGMFFTDLIIVTLSIFVFGVEAFFFAVFSIIITSVTMNYIEVGLNRKKTIFMLSESTPSIIDDIYHEVKRGVTLIPVKGGYNEKDLQMMMVTLNSKDYQQVRRIIDRHDEEAFVIAYDVADVHGRGFTYESPTV